MVDKAQRHKCGQHRRRGRRNALAGEHDPTTAAIVSENPGKHG